MSKTSKIIIGDYTVLDFSTATITTNDVKQGFTFHGSDGEQYVGVLVVTPLTLTVNTSANASVTATKDGITLTGIANASGACILDIPEAGDWNISCTTSSGSGSGTASNVGITETTVKNLAVTITYRTDMANENGAYYVNGQRYTQNSILYVQNGSTVTVMIAKDNYYYYSEIYMNEVRVVNSQDLSVTYSFVATKDAAVEFYYNSTFTARITI